MSTNDDSQRLARLRKGDEQAFESLIEEHYPSMLSLASTFVDDESTAEEVVQETWAAVIDGLDNFEGRSSLETWVFGILTNLARKRGKRDARTVNCSEMAEGCKPTDADGYWSGPPPSWRNDPEQDLLCSQLLDRLEEELDELPERQQAAVRLRDVQGFTSEEVCEILDITPGNQRVLLHRGRTKLRDALDDYLTASGEEKS